MLWLSKFWDSNKKDIKLFIILFCIGVSIHLYAFSNKFFNYFEMGNILTDMSYAQNDTLGLGRWFLPVVTNLFTSFSIPSLNGIVCLGYMCASAVMLIKLVKLESRLLCVLFGTVWLAFPGMASVLSYGVNSDVFSFCIFSAVLAVFIEEKARRGIWFGAIVLAFSIGAYQPFLAMAVAASYCILFGMVMADDFSMKVFLRKALRLFMMLALGFLLYYLVLQMVLRFTGLTLSDYHGIDNMTSFTPKGILKGLVYTYGYFLNYFFSRDYIYTWGRVLWNVIGAAAFLIMLYFRIRSVKKEGGQKIWILAMLFFLPLGLNASPFLMADRVGNGVDRYMLFPLMLMWLLVMKLVEMSRSETENLLHWLALGAVLTAAVSGTVICNEAYHRMDAMTTATGSMMTRIVARMEQLPEWNSEMPVYFVNPKQLFNDNYQVDIPKYEALKNLPGTEIKPWYNEKALINYMKVYLNFPVAAAGDEEKENVRKQEEFLDMKDFPDKDSIKVIDGIIVVKISSDED